MSRRPPLLSVICCAHNEEEYIDRFMPNLLNALNSFSSEVIFVADRCSDRTVGRVQKYKVKVIEKTWRRWRNSYAESLQTGFLNARGQLIAIIDVDLILPTQFFEKTIPMLRGKVASVASQVITYPDTFLSRLIYAWERTYNFAPLGKGPYGAARVIIKRILDEIGGFRDVFSVDTDLDFRLERRGYNSITIPSVKVYHARHESLGSIVSRQIRIGRGRYMIGVSLLRTVAHSIFRLRPFVIAGWFMEWLRTEKS